MTAGLAAARQLLGCAHWEAAYFADLSGCVSPTSAAFAILSGKQHSLLYQFLKSISKRVRNACTETTRAVINTPSLMF